MKLDIESIRHDYALIESGVTSLNRRRILSDLAEDLAVIGYPRS
ncbi:hypothetical protein GCM10029976_042310 [Kribbella albertanoniae]|nr:hypothetical protein [Kribbella albertanoniae]